MRPYTPWRPGFARHESFGSKPRGVRLRRKSKENGLLAGGVLGASVQSGELAIIPGGHGTAGVPRFCLGCIDQPEQEVLEITLLSARLQRANRRNEQRVVEAVEVARRRRTSERCLPLRAGEPALRAKLRRLQRTDDKPGRRLLTHECPLCACGWRVSDTCAMISSEAGAGLS
jgi:hypothetical protein